MSLSAAAQRMAMGLEIGGGNRPWRRDFEQFDAIDHCAETGLVYTLGDARRLPYPDESFPYVYSGNLLEHFPLGETSSVLAEWARVLRTGGVLELVVPDVIGILYAYFLGQLSWEECSVRIRGTDYELNSHHAAFTLAEFPAVIAQVPTLRLKTCVACAEGCGIRAQAVRIKAR